MDGSIIDNTVRYAEIEKEGRWRKINFRHLKAGDIFKLYEPDDTPVCNGELFFACSNPIEYCSTWIIDVEPM